MVPKRPRVSDRYLYGIGEWYGKSFSRLTGEERSAYANIQLLPKKQRPPITCIPRSYTGVNIDCTKEGGVCTIRPYKQDAGTGEVSIAPGDEGALCTTCPYRFYERNLVFQWIGETILGSASPLIVGEVGFLEREESAFGYEEDSPGREDVGRIDHVLVHPNTDVLSWCAVEMQAVYFSGDSMQKEFRALSTSTDDALPFPAGRRRPDFRSSGPKRLMPQLQIKVPTLRRWGKKMCVLVDRNFFHSLGHMESVKHVSNGDIAWFVVRYDESDAVAHLCPDFVHFTTLERAVEGLTAGNPVSLPLFENRIRVKLELQSRR